MKPTAFFREDSLVVGTLSVEYLHSAVGHQVGAWNGVYNLFDLIKTRDGRVGPFMTRYYSGGFLCKQPHFFPWLLQHV
jgi:hypothetical protein